MIDETHSASAASEDLARHARLIGIVTQKENVLLSSGVFMPSPRRRLPTKSNAAKVNISSNDLCKIRPLRCLLLFLRGIRKK